MILALEDSLPTTSKSKSSAVALLAAPKVHNITSLYYLNNGGQSACYTHNKDEELIFAVPSTLWNDTDGMPSDKFCGKKVNVTRSDTGVRFVPTFPYVPRDAN